MLANVSTPTISRFESGDKDIQLSSILNILKMLGMLDHRSLIFPETPNVQYDFDSKKVIFWGKNEADASIRCAISFEALDDHYKSKTKNSMKIFLEHYAAIQHEALRKYLNNQFETDNDIFIKTADL